MNEARIKVLFVSSGNNRYGLGTVVKAQGEALINKGIQVDYFRIKGKGVIGYLLAVKDLIKELNSNHYDLIHAHYSLSAFTATLSFPSAPLVVSLMGSDTKMHYLWRTLIRICSIFFWKAVIVKSPEMKKNLKIKRAVVIPNGIDLKKFSPGKTNDAKKKLAFDLSKKHIIFLSNPERLEKNFGLAKEAINQTNNENIDLLVIHEIPQDEVVSYLNAADCLLLTSFWEGSPNAVKEAMACNCPIVATDVGDVRWLFGETPGHYLTTFDAEDVATKIESALDFSAKYGRTNGRNRIIELGLDSYTISEKIIAIYRRILYVQQ